MATRTLYGFDEDGNKIAVGSYEEIVHYVGGTIFYIDSTANGTYTFKNANDQVVPAPSVGTDCTGWTYTVSGANKDKYYVVHPSRIADNKKWGAAESCIGAEGTTIGTGKSNTTIAINSIFNKSGTIWETIINMRNNKTGNCDDWFIPSKDELEALRVANVTGTYSFNLMVLTSSEIGDFTVHCWDYYSKTWGSMNKDRSTYGGEPLAYFGIRAF